MVKVDTAAIPMNGTGTVTGTVNMTTEEDRVEDISIQTFPTEIIPEGMPFQKIHRSVIDMR